MNRNGRKEPAPDSTEDIRHRCTACQQYVQDPEWILGDAKCPDCHTRLDKQKHPRYIS